MEIICEVLQTKAEKISGSSRFVEDLGADSLDRISLLLALEEQYGSIGDQEAKKFLTVNDVLSFIENSSKIEQKS